MEGFINICKVFAWEYEFICEDAEKSLQRFLEAQEKDVSKPERWTLDEASLRFEMDEKNFQINQYSLTLSSLHRMFYHALLHPSTAERWSNMTVKKVQNLVRLFLKGSVPNSSSLLEQVTIFILARYTIS